jgi:hypothetical protein
MYYRDKNIENILYDFVLRNYCSSAITIKEYYRGFTQALEKMCGGKYFLQQRDRRFTFRDSETGLYITGTPELLYCEYGIHEIVVRTRSMDYKFSFRDFYRPHRKKGLINEYFKHHLV